MSAIPRWLRRARTGQRPMRPTPQPITAEQWNRAICDALAAGTREVILDGIVVHWPVSGR